MTVCHVTAPDARCACGGEAALGGGAGGGGEETATGAGAEHDEGARGDRAGERPRGETSPADLTAKEGTPCASGQLQLQVIFLSSFFFSLII